MVKGWDERKIVDIAPLQRGFDLPARKIVAGQHPVVYSNGVGDYHNTYMVKAPGLITGRSGTIGSLHFVEKDYWPHNTTLWVTDFKGNYPKFIYFLFQTFDWKNFATGSGVPTLNRNDVHESSLLIPKSIKEQNAIATALSDVDDYIAALERLITKKSNIRKGAMQELLTGKRRLPGFEALWENRTLESMCNLITKQTGFDYTTTIKPSLSMEQQRGYIPFIQNKDFDGDHINFTTDFYIPIDVAEMFPKILLNEPCLLVSISGRIGNVGYFANQQIAFIGGAVGIAKFKNPQNIKWVMLYLQSNEGQRMIFANEKAGAQHNLTVADIRNFMISYPQPEEQIAISTILSDMDAEINALTAKLNKARNIKQGMMQELLTGRIRLIQEDADNAED